MQQWLIEHQRLVLHPNALQICCQLATVKGIEVNMLKASPQILFALQFASVLHQTFDLGRRAPDHVYRLFLLGH